MDWPSLTSIAENAARSAGDILQESAECLREVEFEDRNDVKLRADREAELLIREQLQSAAPYPVYGEELGGDLDLLQGDTPFWIVDPLDGTFNYLRHNPLCGVSIGLMQGTEPLLGVIYHFAEGALYTGSVAQALQINGQPATPQWAPGEEKAALVTGFPAGMDTSPPRMQAFIKTLARFKKIRMLGSASMALAYVASGRADVYYEEGVRLWDVAAGLALVKAAGGAVKLSPADTGKVLAYDVWAGKGAFLP
jgi:myo-inositol-1(or 4)-monophosphatase